MHQDVYVCLGFRVCVTWKPKKVCFSSGQVLSWVWGSGFGIWTQAQVFIGLISGSMLLRDSLHEPCWGSLLGKYHQTLNPKPLNLFVGERSYGNYRRAAERPKHGPYKSAPTRFLASTVFSPTCGG